MYNPFDWYWKKDNANQAFSSARKIMVSESDAGYLAHVAANGAATRWPQDAAGVQTNAALQEVLGPYNIDVDLISYAARKRWMKETSGIEVGGMSVATDDRSKQMIMGARIAAAADNAFVTPWVSSDGTITSLTAAQIIAVSDAVLDHVQSCFETFATIKAGIDNNTITTRAQVDSAFGG